MQSAHRIRKNMGSFCIAKILLNYSVNYAKLNSAKLIKYNITSIIFQGNSVPFGIVLLCSFHEFDKNANSDDMSAVMLVILN